MSELIQNLDVIIEKLCTIKSFLQDCNTLQDELIKKIDRTQKGAAEELLERLP